MEITSKRIAGPTVRRATCAACGLDVNQRADGRLGEHRLFDGGTSTICAGSLLPWSPPALPEIPPTLLRP